jgi:hypothetical protein
LPTRILIPQTTHLIPNLRSKEYFLV